MYIVNLGNELPKTNRIGSICLFRKYITNFEMLFDVENYQNEKKRKIHFDFIWKITFKQLFWFDGEITLESM